MTAYTQAEIQTLINDYVPIRWSVGTSGESFILILTALATGRTDITAPAGSNLTLSAGAGGNLVVSGLPTSDPHVVGALWNSSGVLHISSG